MKKILYTLLMVFCSYNAHSQIHNDINNYSLVSIDTDASTPRYLTQVNSGKIDTVGVVLTIEQAKKADNDLELLKLYRNMRTDCDSTVNYLIMVVDNYKQLNILAETKFTAYDISIDDLKKQIANLNERIRVKDEQIITKSGIITDMSGIISVDDKEISHLKKQKMKFRSLFYISAGGFLYMLVGHPGIR